MMPYDCDEVYLPVELATRIRASAQSAGRSMTSEIISRLEESFAASNVPPSRLAKVLEALVEQGVQRRLAQ